MVIKTLSGLWQAVLMQGEVTTKFTMEKENKLSRGDGLLFLEELSKYQQVPHKFG
jgi:hypothetical protein